jgi:signal peptidase I
MSEATLFTGKVNGPRLPRLRRSLWVIVLLVLIGIWSIGRLVLQTFTMRAQSMEPTLLVGDCLLVKRFILGGRNAGYHRFLPYKSIGRGDIIVFKLPVQDHPFYIKRVIGMPGDRVKIVSQRVYVNGQLQAEPYAEHDPAAYDPYGDNFPPANHDFSQRGVRPEWAEQIFKYAQRDELVVPAEHYFVLGDKREHSWDSRYWGFVDQDAIFGRALIILWSASSAGMRSERMFHTVR